jgi:hypothetical protein
MMSDGTRGLRFINPAGLVPIRKNRRRDDQECRPIGHVTTRGTLAPSQSRGALPPMEARCLGSFATSIES